MQAAGLSPQGRIDSGCRPLSPTLQTSQSERTVNTAFCKGHIEGEYYIYTSLGEIWPLNSGTGAFNLLHSVSKQATGMPQHAEASAPLLIQYYTGAKSLLFLVLKHPQAAGTRQAQTYAFFMQTWFATLLQLVCSG